MSFFKILVAEILYRKVQFAMSLVAVVVAAGLFVAGPLLVDAYRMQTQAEIGKWKAQLGDLEKGVGQLRQNIEAFEAKTKAEMAELEEKTRKTMRDLGFNLMITHRDTNMADFWAEDFASHDMPEEYVEKLANAEQLTLVRHLVATLQAKITWNNRKVLLVGYRREVPQAHLSPVQPMGKQIEPGTVWLGSEIGHGLKEGDETEVLGRKFVIAKIMPETGSKEDITIAMNLKDAQEVLDKPGRINQILALGCHCAGGALPLIRAQLEAVLPDTRIVEYKTLALAREEQRTAVEQKQQALLAEMKRNLAEREEVLRQRRKVVEDMERSRMQILAVMQTLSETVTPLVVLGCVVWLGLLAMANVKQRQTEIGILRAIGKTSRTIAGLFLGKATLVGVLGAIVGAPLGYLAAQWLGSQAFSLSSELFSSPWDLFAAAIVGAPVLSALAAYWPMLAAIRQDPAVVLREP
ncbi:hypothetical protein JCM19992_09580 [Thermostilla marina]